MLIAKDKQGNLINLLESHPGKGQYFVQLVVQL